MANGKEVTIKIGGDAGELLKVLSQIQQQLKKTESDAESASSSLGNAGAGLTKGFQSSLQGLKPAGESIEQYGKQLSDFSAKTIKYIVGMGTAAAGAVAVAVKSATGVGGEFEAQMIRVQALSNATTAQFEMLNAKAREMGATLPIMAKEAAEAMTVLAQRGMNPEQIMQSIDAITSLSITQQHSLEGTSNIVGAITKTFKIDLADLSGVVDSLNNASANSALNMGSIGEAMKYAAPNAKMLNMSLDETLSAVMALADAGLEGGLAGRGLSGFLASISAPSQAASESLKKLRVDVKDASGALRSWKDVLRDLKNSAYSASDIFAIFGAGNADVANSLMNAVDELDEYEKKLKQVGTTARMLNAEMKSFVNIEKALASAFESVNITFFDQIKEQSKGFLGDLTEMMRAFDAWTKKTNIGGEAFDAFMRGLGVNMEGLDFKGWLDQFDVSTVVSKVEGLAAGLRSVGESFVTLFKMAQPALSFIVDNMETITRIAAGGWIIGKVTQLSGALLAMAANMTIVATQTTWMTAAMGTASTALSSFWVLLGKSFDFTTLTLVAQGAFAAIKAGLATGVAGIGPFIANMGSLTTASISLGKAWATLKTLALATIPLGTLGTILLGGAAIQKAIDFANEYKQAMQEAQEASEREADTGDQAAQAQLALAAAQSLKTGYEDLGHALDGLDKKYVDLATKMQEKKQLGFINAVNEFNEGLSESEQQFKITQAQIKALAENGLLHRALLGEQDVIATLGPQMQKAIELFERAKTVASGSSDEIASSLEKDMQKIKAWGEKQQQELKDRESALPNAIKEIQPHIDKFQERLRSLMSKGLSMNEAFKSLKPSFDEATKAIKEKLEAFGPEIVALWDKYIGDMEGLDQKALDTSKFNEEIAKSKSELADFQEYIRRTGDTSEYATAKLQEMADAIVEKEFGRLDPIQQAQTIGNLEKLGQQAGDKYSKALAEKLKNGSKKAVDDATKAASEAMPSEDDILSAIEKKQAQREKKKKEPSKGRERFTVTPSEVIEAAGVAVELSGAEVDAYKKGDQAMIQAAQARIQAMVQIKKQEAAVLQKINEDAARKEAELEGKRKGKVAGVDAMAEVKAFEKAALGDPAKQGQNAAAKYWTGFKQAPPPQVGAGAGQLAPGKEALDPKAFDPKPILDRLLASAQSFAQAGQQLGAAFLQGMTAAMSTSLTANLSSLLDFDATAAGSKVGQSWAAGFMAGAGPVMAQIKADLYADVTARLKKDISAAAGG